MDANGAHDHRSFNHGTPYWGCAADRSSPSAPCRPGRDSNSSNSAGCMPESRSLK